jgi:DNA-binding NtrC family response regulator
MDETRSILTSKEGQPALEIQRPVLVVLEGVDAGRQHVLPEGPVVLGRGADAEVRLEDPSSSRRHARLRPDGDAWLLEDLGSKSGTFVGDEPCEATRIEPGQDFRIGATRMRLEVTTLVVLAPVTDEEQLGPLVGGSRAMRELFALIRQVATLELPVTIQGETGTGKEGVARALHECSHRADGPYVVVDCTLLAGDHLRSELFGHVKGAFTGADADRDGAFDRADGGTLFLDEVAELPLELQATLLRALQEGEVRPLGGDTVRRVDVRVVSASHQDLAELVRRGELREDLYYRLSAVHLAVPPLRERPDDVPVLARHFLPDTHRLSSAARRALEEHPWPGNVRELEQAMRVAGALATSGLVEVEHLQLREAPDALQAGGGVAPAAPAAHGLSRSEFEEAEIRRALAEHRHHRGKAAKALGIARSTLYERMKKYGIE